MYNFAFTHGSLNEDCTLRKVQICVALQDVIINAPDITDNQSVFDLHQQCSMEPTSGGSTKLCNNAEMLTSLRNRCSLNVPYLCDTMRIKKKIKLFKFGVHVLVLSTFAFFCLLLLTYFLLYKII